MPTLRLPEEVEVVNVGLPLFGEAVRAQGARAVDVDWRIPAGGRPDLVAALARLDGRSAPGIDAANAEVFRRLDQGAPQLVEVGRAIDVVPDMDDRMLLHSGPPIPWEEMADPLRRSVRAVVMAEGWAPSPEAADELVGVGGVQLEPANHHATVCPMASVLGPRSPVFVVDSALTGTRAFSGVNQGPGKVAWFGVDAPDAVERLVLLQEVALPVLAETVRASGPVDLFALVSQGLQMGDDSHMRTQATTNLLIRQILPHLAAVEHPGRVEMARLLSQNHLFFLNLAMAAAKAVADGAADVAGSSIVVGMARNGTTFGIRVAGMEDRWFVTDAPPVGDALYYAGFGPDVAAPDIGDSAVLELVGLGGAASAAAPAVAAFIGGTMQDAVATTEKMDLVCEGRSGRFKLPYLGFRGTPVGVDLRKVVETQITPAVNTGILHATTGHGQIGAGIARAPLRCFQDALLALDESLHPPM
jgi:hypothetical protein